jgi:hypothetical protein
MKTLNNKGIALITALMLTLITLVIISGVLFIVTNNTKSSGANKAYRNVTEAAYGGSDLIMQDIIPRLFQNVSTNTLRTEYNTSSLANMNMLFNSSACLRTKLNNPVSSGWGSCSSTLDPKVQPDMKFNLAGSSGQGYTVYTKIVDTVKGVQYPPPPPGGQPLMGGGVTESSAPTTTNLIHYVYRIEVEGERTVNPTEKSNLSVLYEY